MRDRGTTRRRRSASSIRHHYDVERVLADRLRDAVPGARAALYTEVYDELFRSVPDHPQLTETSARTRAQRVEHKRRLIAPYVSPTTRLLEIGCGDGAFAAAMSSSVGSVVAMDVSAVIIGSAAPAPNVEMLLNHGTDVPVEPASIDLAFSDQLMEHLHPDDATTQLTNVATALKPGAWYVLSTPSRFSGPHDISSHFDDVATGLHLREYSLAELRPLLSAAGFGTLHTYAGGRGRYVRVPNLVVRAAERAVGLAPRAWRRRIGRFLPIRAVLGLHLAAQRRAMP